jgi:hypothetical protein
MRLVAWNIRQGGGSRLPRIADALKRQDADILVLSEYRGALPQIQRAKWHGQCPQFLRSTMSNRQCD